MRRGGQVTKCSDRLSSTQEKAPAAHTFRTPAQRKALSLSLIFAATFLPARPVLISKRVISMIDEVLLGWKGGAIGQIVAQLFTFHFLEDKLLQQ